MDLLFREYASPFVLLDTVIPSGQFVNFLETFEKKHEEKVRWEFFLHKLSAFDNRSWNEFNNDVDFETAKQQKPSEADLKDTIRHSMEIFDRMKKGGEG